MTGNMARRVAADAVPDIPAPVPGRERSTHFVFAHKVFAIENAFFAMTTDRQPAFHIDFGGLRAAVELRSLRRGFGIAEGTPDDDMLRVVERALRFVREIRPNDSIPSEVVDGTASWAAAPEHREVAQARLMLHLASWQSGAPASHLHRSQVRVLAANAAIAARVQEAAAEIGQQLDGVPDGAAFVLERIAAFARELSYIEAIRERFEGIRTVQLKAARLLALYKTERFLGESLTRIAALLKGPAEMIGQALTEADGHGADIVGLCRAYEQKTASVRAARDALFELHMLWEPVLAQWHELPVERSRVADDAIRTTFQFLARNYPQHVAWKRT